MSELAAFALGVALGVAGALVYVRQLVGRVRHELERVKALRRAWEVDVDRVVAESERRRRVAEPLK